MFLTWLLQFLEMKTDWGVFSLEVKLHYLSCFQFLYWSQFLKPWPLSIRQFLSQWLRKDSKAKANNTRSVVFDSFIFFSDTFPFHIYQPKCVFNLIHIFCSNFENYFKTNFFLSCCLSPVPLPERSMFERRDLLLSERPVWLQMHLPAGSTRKTLQHL